MTDGMPTVPTGMKAINQLGFSIDQSDSIGTWATAMADCSARGVALPTASQLQMIYGNNSTISATTTPLSTSYYWSSQGALGGSYDAAYVVNLFTGVSGPSSYGNTGKYRCVK